MFINDDRTAELCSEMTSHVDDVRVIHPGGRVLSHQTALIVSCSFTPSTSSLLSKGISAVSDSFTLFPVESARNTDNGILNRKKISKGQVRIIILKYLSVFPIYVSFLDAADL